MKHKNYNKKIKIINLVILMLISNVFFGQTTSLSLSWDKEVGCQILSNEGGHDPKDQILISDIGASQCIRVCENTIVKYTLSNVPPGSTTTWNATGGIAFLQSTTSCTVNWGSIGTGSLSFNLTNPSVSGMISTSICIEKIPLPIAYFITGLEEGQNPTYLYVCKGQTINFTNLSSANNGSEIYSYHWDFGDGTTSSAQNPQHVFTEETEYNIILTATNACNCSNTYKITIVPEGEGFDISCPSIVCEGQKVIYSLPFDGMKICNENFNWSVSGGTEVNEAGGNYEVLWDNVDASGFGTITFNPSGCDLPCLQPTSIRVPVIQTVGTISGDQSICVGGQSVYKLPQWPTTDFQWEIISGNSLATLVQSDQRNEVILTAIEEGFVTIKCTYMNTLLKCGGTAEYLIEIVKPIGFIGETVICQGGTINFATEFGESVNWSLTNSNGVPIASATDTNGFSFELVGNYAAFSGTLYLSIGNTSASGCPNQTKSIQVITRPRIPTTITGEDTICPGAPYVYSVAGSTSQNDYVWEVMGGSFVGSDTGTQVSVIFNANGPYSLSVYNESLFPTTCRSIARTININKKVIEVEIKNIGNDFVSCTNTTDIYKVYVLGTSNVYAIGEQYTWSINPPSAGSIISGQNSNQIQVLWNNVATTSQPIINLEVKECTITEPFEHALALVPAPEISLSINPNTTTVCSGSNITYTIASENNVDLTGATVIWNFNGNEITNNSLTYNYPFDNTSGTDADVQVTAMVSNVAGCPNPSNQVFLDLTILTGPDASVSIGSNTENAFCDATEINTHLIAATTATNVTFQWYKDEVAIVGAVDDELYSINDLTTGFGTYHVVITNSNGCSTSSNYTSVIQYCDEPIDCTVTPTPTIQNLSSVDCTNLYAIGSTNVPPLAQNIKIIGPNSYLAPNNSTIPLERAGIYHVFYQTTYNCLEGQQSAIQLLKKLVVPYLADFDVLINCTNNNQFMVSFIDQNEIFALVQTPSITYSYRLAGNPSTPYTTVIGTQVTLAAGTYEFMCTVTGFYDDTAQPACTKVISKNLQSIANNEIVNDDIFCDYTAVEFNLDEPLLPTETILWTLEAPIPANPNIVDTVTSTVTNPKRVFTTPGIYIIKATVTNNNGCERTFEKPITVPEPCFGGNVVSNPNPATVCLNDGVQISYNELNANACTVEQYVWMKGTTEFQTTTTNSITVDEPGFYWVKVYSGDGCEYSSPSRITPAFITPPALRIKGASSACINEIVPIEALTAAETVVWTIDNDVAFTGPTLLEFGNYPTGVHTLTATISDANGCSNEVTHVITVFPEPAVPVVNVNVHCTPFQYTLNILNYNSAYTYNWSNGQTGEYCYATDGGAVSVTAHMGGCAATNQFDLPKDPSNYTWIFPNGCFSICKDNEGYLIGPRALFNEWHYDINGELVTEGENIPTPFNQLNQDDTYTLTLQTEGCNITTPPLVLDTQGCTACKFLSTSIVKRVESNLTLPYCAFTATLSLTNTDTNSYWVTLTSPNENFIIVPSSVLIEPGVNENITVTLIPINGFVGSTVMALQYLNSHGELCETLMEFKLPSCDSSNLKEIGSTTSEQVVEKTTITLYPNPAKEQVTIAFSSATPEIEVTIYDVTGRLMQTLQSNQTEGTWQVTTSAYQSGLYIVTVSTKNKLVKQYKLIIE
ncbi:MAG: T9SS type A sorting domain-containing protein [Crocinitomicaceae bacterium]|nr:T9SS type A sorting domain-containing protein [Crocinitomicaceae bacterium]